MIGMVLAAGAGRRLAPLTDALPKTLLPVDGERTILDVVLGNLRQVGLEEAVVITGFAAGRVSEQRDGLETRHDLRLHLVLNDRAEEWNNAYSLWCARDYFDAGVLLCNGDTVHPAGVEESVLDARGGIATQDIAFTVTDEKNVELWIAEAAKAVTKRVLRQPLNAALGTPYRWRSDSKGFVVTMVPEDRGPEPPEPPVPVGPVVQENIGKAAPARTYQDLLTNPYDELLFEHYGTSQIMLVDMGGHHDRIGSPAIFRDFDPSPDGKYLLVETLHKPFSYVVPGDRFPRKIEIWDMDGKVVKMLADVPLQEEVPVEPLLDLIAKSRAERPSCSPSPSSMTCVSPSFAPHSA